jgi:anti-sigma regulatory factor (Ser/Thr protein kinase)
VSRVSLLLPSDALAPWRARRYAAAECQKLPDDAQDVVLLLVSELVTNAVVHGEGEPLLDVAVEEGVVIVGVSDRGGGVVHPASRFSWPETGHGLILVQSLSHRWGVEEVIGTGGKRVWFELAWGADEA